MRIPRSILADSNGDLAGNNQQLVLYNIPSSLTIPEEKDSVRKAIIETRARARDQARSDHTREAQTASASPKTNAGTATVAPTSYTEAPTPLDAMMVEDDPDAMDLS